MLHENCFIFQVVNVLRLAGQGHYEVLLLHLGQVYLEVGDYAEDVLFAEHFGVLRRGVHHFQQAILELL